MDGTRQKIKKDYESWLLNFENQMEKPCIVSLLIERYWIAERQAKKEEYKV